MSKRTIIALLYAMQVSLLMILTSVIVWTVSLIDKDLPPIFPYVIIVTNILMWIALHPSFKKNAEDIYEDVIK